MKAFQTLGLENDGQVRLQCKKIMVLQNACCPETNMFSDRPGPTTSPRQPIKERAASLAFCRKRSAWGAAKGGLAPT